MIDLYIYYQVPEAQAGALQALVTAMQARLSARHGVQGQLKRRPEGKDGLLTWMEVYPAAPDGFSSILDAAAQEARLAALTAGPRHAEVFMDLTPCA